MSNTYNAPNEPDLKWSATQQVIGSAAAPKTPNVGADPEVRDDHGDRVENTTVQFTFSGFHIEWERKSVLEDAIDLGLETVNLGKHVGEGVNTFISALLATLRAQLLPVRIILNAQVDPTPGLQIVRDAANGDDPIHVRMTARTRLTPVTSPGIRWISSTTLVPTPPESNHIPGLSSSEGPSPVGSSSFLISESWHEATAYKVLAPRRTERSTLVSQLQVDIEPNTLLEKALHQQVITILRTLQALRNGKIDIGTADIDAATNDFVAQCKDYITELIRSAVVNIRVRQIDVTYEIVSGDSFSRYRARLDKEAAKLRDILNGADTLYGLFNPPSLEELYSDWPEVDGEDPGPEEEEPR